MNESFISFPISVEAFNISPIVIDLFKQTQQFENKATPFKKNVSRASIYYCQMSQIFIHDLAYALLFFMN